MSAPLQSVNVFVNSARRQAGTNTVLTVYLNPPLIRTAPNTAWDVRVVTATIPYSLTQLDATNNQLFGFIGATPWSLTVPEGNYNILELIAKTKPLLEAAAGITTTWTYDRPTGKTTLTYVTGTGALVLDHPSSSVLMEMFGFDQTFTLNPGQQRISHRGVNVNPVQSLFIRSSTLTQAGGKEWLLSQNETTDILAEVQINVTPYSFINWVNPDQMGIRLTNTIIDRVELYLSTNLNFQVSLNGQPWSCQLVFNEVVLPVGDPLPLLENLARLQFPSTDTQVGALEAERNKVLAELEAERDKILRSIKRSNERAPDAEDGGRRPRPTGQTLQGPTRG